MSRVHFDGVTFAYAQQVTLQNVTFDVPAGSITAILGPSGSGKTTCLRLLAGLETPNKGSISFGNTERAETRATADSSRNAIGYAFQENALWPGVPAWKQLDLVMKNKHTSSNERKQQCIEWLSRVQLQSKAEAIPETLSGGEQRRLSLVRALASSPDVLLLDEPLSSVEGPLRSILSEQIRTAKTETRSILLVTHHREEAFALADRLVLMSNGKVIQQGETTQVTENPASIEAANLLGYKTFIEAQHLNEHIETLPASLRNHGLDSSTGNAAWYPEHLSMTPSEESSFSCVACVYQGPFYLVTARHQTGDWTGCSMNEIPLHTPVLVEVIRPPVWIPSS